MVPFVACATVPLTCVVRMRARSSLAGVRGSVSRSSMYVKRSVMVAWDALAWALALFAFFLVRFDLTLSERVWNAAIAYTIAAIALQIIGGFRFHLYLGRSRIGSFDEVTALGTLSPAWPSSWESSSSSPSRSSREGSPSRCRRWPSSSWRPAAGCSGAATANGRRQGDSSEAVPALVYGAGDAGHQVALLVDTADEPPYSIIGFIDDDPSKRFLRVRGHRVLGRGEDAHRRRPEDRCGGHHPRRQPGQPEDDPGPRGPLQECGSDPRRRAPGARDDPGSDRPRPAARVQRRRPARAPPGQDRPLRDRRLPHRQGGPGHRCRRVDRVRAGPPGAQLGPSRLVLLDRDESALHAVQLLDLRLGPARQRRPRAVRHPRRRPRSTKVFDAHRPDVVFHAAALKHLPMLERYPEEGWKTNVVGSLNVLRARHVKRRRALRQHLDRQGRRRDERAGPDQAPRRAAHRLVRRARPACPTCRVRFGNVLGSRGSVLDTFRAQIERGGPVTVTHPDVTRFFMTIPEACELVLQAGAIGEPGDVLVLDMGEPVRILDVARRLIDESGQRASRSSSPGSGRARSCTRCCFSATERAPRAGTRSSPRCRCRRSSPAPCSSTTPAIDRIVEMLRSQAVPATPADCRDVGQAAPSGDAGVPLAVRDVRRRRSSGSATSDCRWPSSSPELHEVVGYDIDSAAGQGARGRPRPHPRGHGGRAARRRRSLRFTDDPSATSRGRTSTS